MEEDLTSLEELDSFHTLSEALREQDEEMVRKTMEAAFSQFNTIGSSDFHGIGPQIAPSANNALIVRDWVCPDNSLCGVLS